MRSASVLTWPYHMLYVTGFRTTKSPRKPNRVRAATHYRRSRMLGSRRFAANLGRVSDHFKTNLVSAKIEEFAAIASSPTLVRGTQRDLWICLILFSAAAFTVRFGLTLTF